MEDQMFLKGKEQKRKVSGGKGREREKESMEKAGDVEMRNFSYICI